MLEECSQYRFEELKKELAREFEKTKQVTHKLIDDLTVIRGYAEIMVMRGDGAKPSVNFGRSLLEPNNP